eukprot:CAMPEP_0171326378 /NCGR_PEP_ID=MMETSP0816-20121228/117417_1 /TAXON_ID=420281 /ORGANISM="Proboscia inermis, Strain CCAP1064/1" /LENGTH=131 /DNA_ID=CAMNT_0011825831 /DNA_START=731 /DNA_END=1126 /DNA_ORIENTATION=-
MTEGSNRFGVAFAIIILCESIGGAFSNLISGYVVGASTYEIGFIFLLCTGAVSLYFIHAMKVESAFACEGKNGEKEKKSFPRMVDLSSKVQVKHDLTADGASNSDEKGKKSTPSINHINQSESENKETTEA